MLLSVSGVNARFKAHNHLCLLISVGKPNTAVYVVLLVVKKPCLFIPSFLFLFPRSAMCNFELQR